MLKSILNLIALVSLSACITVASAESAGLRGGTASVDFNRRLNNGNGNGNGSGTSNGSSNGNGVGNTVGNGVGNGNGAANGIGNGNGNAYAYGLGNGNSLMVSSDTVNDAGPSGQCMQDVFNMKTKQNSTLSCKKQTIVLEQVASLNRATCTAGETIVVDLKASMVMKGGRYDVGWYIATDGGNAKTGSCLVSTLQQDKNYTVTSRNGKAGTVAWDQDAKPDTLDKNDACGDVFFNGGGAGTIDVDDLLVSTEVQCVDSNNDGNLDFGICFTFRNNGNDSKCDPFAPFPGDTRTCDCARYDVPQITVEKAVKSSNMC